MKNVKIITVESDLGAGTRGAKLGPQALLKTINKNNPSLLADITINVVSPDNTADDGIYPMARNIETIINIQNRIIELVQNNLANNHISLVISGDHSNGLAGISAIKNFYPHDNIGVIWIDAHADIHSPFTSPSGNLHGMPLAAALAIGSTSANKNNISAALSEKWNELISLGDKKISPKLNPEHLVFIDIRDMEKEEKAILQDKNIFFFTHEQKREIGINAIIDQTLDHLSHCDHLLVSFDVDSLDPTVSCGTGTPVPGGLNIDEAVELLNAFLVQPKLKLFEITEINPLFDRIHPMEEIAAEIFQKVIGSLQQ